MKRLLKWWCKRQCSKGRHKWGKGDKENTIICQRQGCKVDMMQFCKERQK